MKGIFTLTLLLTLFISLRAQDPPDPALLCDDAPILCDLSIISGYTATMTTMNSPGPQPNPLCAGGGGFPHNIVWFGFVAGADFVSIDIDATNCTQIPDGNGGVSQGVQAGIYEDCSFSTTIDCEGNCQTAPFTLSGNVIPGQTYYIFIDGCAGSVCDIVVTITQGGEPYTVPDPTGDLEFNFAYDGFNNCPGPCDEFCLGGDASLIFPVLAGSGGEALDYEWTVTDPNGTNVLEDQTYTEDFNFNIDGVWTICAKAVTGCDESDPSCRTILIKPAAPQLLDDFEVCEDDFPTSGPPEWLGGSISGPGTYTVDVESADGFSCDFQQEITIISLPNSEPFYLEHLTCDNQYTVCNEILGTDVSNYEISCPDMAANGCDSVVIADVKFAFAIGNLKDPNCENGMFHFEYDGIVAPFDAMISYTLYHNGDVVLTGSGQPSEADLAVPIAAGFYSLEIVVEEFGQSCSFASNVVSTASGTIPDQPELASDLSLNPCILDQVVYGLSSSEDPSSTYQWTITPNDPGLDTTDNNFTLNIDWNSADFDNYTICVAEDNGCALGPDSCFVVNVLSAPNASFILPDTTCINSDVVITYDGTALGAGTYNWNFSGGVTDPSDTNAPGPFNVNYSTVGKKILTLDVAEGSCASEVYKDSIMVVSPFPDPVISCSSTENSITFTWADIPGSTSYVVNVLNAPPTSMVAVNEIAREVVVTNLTAGEIVEISVEVLGNDYCENSSTTIDCQAQDCPPTELTILNSVDNICLDGSVVEVDLDVDINPSGAGQVSWSGPGITDNVQGIFDPIAAGSGTHQIVVTYLSNGCQYTESTTIVIQEQPVSTFSISTDTICRNGTLMVNYTGTYPNSDIAWDFDGATIISGTGSGPYELEWSTSGKKDISAVTTENGCSSELFGAYIQVDQELDNPIITCESSTNSVLFTWDPVDNAKEYSVFINNVLQGNQLTNSYDVTGLVPGDNVKITVVAISNNACQDATSTFECQASLCNDIVLELTPTQTEVCLITNSAIVPINLDYSGGEADAVLTWVGTGVDQSGNFDPNVAGVGEHEIIINYKYQNCEESDTTIIEVKAVPVSMFEADQNICAGETIDLNFTGTFVDMIDYKWTISGGTIENVAGQYQATFNNPGDFSIELIVEEDGCESESFELEIKVDQPLQEPNFSCDAKSDAVTFSWTDVDCAKEYIIFVNDVQVTTQSNTEYTVENLMENENVNLKITAISECACGDETFEFNCAAASCPDIVPLVEEVTSFCLSEATDNLPLSVNISGGDGSETTEWIGDNVTSSGVFNSVAAGVGVHKVTALVKWSNCEYMDESTITIFENPSIEVEGIDPKCFGDSNGSITVTPSGGDGNYTLLVNNKETQVNDLVESLDYGTYSIVLQDGNGCTDTKSVTLQQPNEEELEIEGENSIIFGSTTMLDITTSIDSAKIDSIIWTDSDNNIICEGTNICEGLEVMPDEDTEYCVRIIFNDGCEIRQCKTVSVFRVKNVFVPNVFSPNGDNVNDVISINANSEIVSVPFVRIFDRWGNKIVDLTDVQLGETIWDGTYKGEALNSGVFVYMLSVTYKDGTNDVIYGDITLLK